MIVEASGIACDPSLPKRKIGCGGRMGKIRDRHDNHAVGFWKFSLRLFFVGSMGLEVLHLSGKALLKILELQTDER